MSSRRTDNIEILSEQLESLQIMNKASEEYKWSDIEMLTTPVPASMINMNKQAIISKSMVLDSEWFNRDQMKFKDWWRGIQLYLKSNRVIETDNRITAILACLRGGVAGIYTQKKLNKLDKELETQNWNNFVKEIKTTFSNKTKAADAK